MRFFDFSKKLYFHIFSLYYAVKHHKHSQDRGNLSSIELHVARNWSSWTSDCKISRQRDEYTE